MIALFGPFVSTRVVDGESGQRSAELRVDLVRAEHGDRSRRKEPEVTEESEVVRDAPVLDDLAVLEAEALHQVDVDVLAGGRDPQIGAGVRAGGMHDEEDV